MVTKLKILSTPYYVTHNVAFDTKPVSIGADGVQMCSRPLLGDMHIAFKVDRLGHHKEIVIMNDLRIWLFVAKQPPVGQFTIGEKVTPDDMIQHIRDLKENGDQIEIEYENV